MRSRLLIAFVPDNKEELISFISHPHPIEFPGFTIDIKPVLNGSSLSESEIYTSENYEGGVIPLYNKSGLGKIHKIVFQYAAYKAYDFVVVATTLQFNYLSAHASELLHQLTRDIAYLTGGDIVSSRIGLVNFIQRRVFKKQLNLFPKICIYSCRSLEKIPYLYNSDDVSFINEIAIQVILSDLTYREVKTDIRISIPYRIKINTIKVFLQAYLHSLGIFYQEKFDVITNNLQYSLKLGYPSSHTYALEAVASNSRVMDIGAGPYGIGHELKAKNCTITTVDQFDIPEKYKLHQHIVANLNDDFKTPVADYDYILFLDILEHIVSPEVFLFQLSKQYSYKKQRIILTTANVCFLPVRLMMLLGYFNYGKTGILDKTHTRLFTFSSFKKLVSDSGLTILKVKGIPGPFPKALGDNFVSRLLLIVNSFLIWLSKGLFSYQIYIEAETAPSVLFMTQEALKKENESDNKLISTLVTP